MLSVEAHGNELVVATDNGSAADQPGRGRARRLRACAVRDLTLRTPTLDDVFLELTGTPHRTRRRNEEAALMTSTDRRSRRLAASPTDVVRAQPAGFVHDVASIAGPRAARGASRHRGRDAAGVHRAVLLHREHRHARTAHRVGIPGFDYTAFQMPTAILLGVTGVSRAPALVLDVQDGYFDRLLLTPVRRLAILLGHMVADVTVAAALTVPILVARVHPRRALRDRPARHRRVHRDRGAVEPRVRRASATRSRSRPATRPR